MTNKKRLTLKEALEWSIKLWQVMCDENCEKLEAMDVLDFAHDEYIMNCALCQYFRKEYLPTGTNQNSVDACQSCPIATELDPCVAIESTWVKFTSKTTSKKKKKEIGDKFLAVIKSAYADLVLAEQVESKELKEKKEGPILYCGLTAKQWKQVAENHTLVYVRDNDESTATWQGPFILERMNGSLVPFDAGQEAWEQARIAYDVPGHIIPHFGGEMPNELEEKRGIVQFRNNEWSLKTGFSDWVWSHDGEDGDIMNFIILPTDNPLTWRG